MTERRQTWRRGLNGVGLTAGLVLASMAGVASYMGLARGPGEATGARAKLAADSGVSFLRYALSRVSVHPETREADVLAEIYADLCKQLDGTANLGGGHVVMSDGQITIPSADPRRYVALDNDAQFRATIRASGDHLTIDVIGRHRNDLATQTVSQSFVKRGHRTRLFDFAVASRGQVVIKKPIVTSAQSTSPTGVCSTLHASSTSSIHLAGGTVGGDLFVCATKDDVAISKGTVGGSDAAAVIKDDHTHVIQAPDFPQVDTTPFKRFAAHTWADGYPGPLEDLLIPPNSNPRFGGGKDKVDLKGIIYVQSPNTVTFRGSVTLEGVIVLENAGSSAVNVLDFGGGLTQLPVPADERFGELAALARGYAILAPTAGVSMAGSSDSTFVGSLLLGKFALTSSADVRVQRGSLITCEATPAACVIDGQRLVFSGLAGADTPTTGLTYSAYYVPGSPAGAALAAGE